MISLSAERTIGLTHAPQSARLVQLLQDHALLHGEFTLSSGARAEYLVDAKRLVARADGFRVVGDLVADYVKRWDATAIGGLTLGAEPIAFATLAALQRESSNDPDAAEPNLKVFMVRKQPKQHGLEQQIEGPPLGDTDSCLVVDDVVTTGASTLSAIRALQVAGVRICGVISVVDRLAGGRRAIEGVVDAPYVSLCTIDQVFPKRPDR
jgi:orotate phosphoribosyltransferase